MEEIEMIDSHRLTEEEFLKSYDASKFDRPSVTNDILIFTADDVPEDNPRKVPQKGLQILLIQRREHPEIGKFAIPGGFVNMDEGLKEGAYRELKEETGLDNVYVEQLYTFGDVGRDKRTRVISVGNVALVPKSSVHPEAGDDAMDYKWFWINKTYVGKADAGENIVKTYKMELISEDDTVKMVYEVKETRRKGVLRESKSEYRHIEGRSLAFDHYKILDYGIERLRNKVEYTPIAFNLLPRLFTVKELQFVYEAILGKEVLNFRRKIGDMIIETEEKIEGKPFRPAKVFKFNEDWEHEF